LEPVLSVAGPFGMYLSLVEAALATDPIALELRASALRTYARTLWSVGKVPQSEPVLEEALAIARERGDARLEGRVLFDLGTQWLLRTETAHAESFFTSALTILRAAGDRLTEGLTLVWLGRVRIMQGRLAEAQAHLEQGLERLREVGGRRRQADAIGGLADIALKQGRSEEASNHYARAIGLFREVGDRHNQAWALTNLAIVEQDRGELARARGTYEEARRIARDIGYRRLEANNLLYWATCLQEQGLDGEARQSLEQAQTMLHQTDDKWGEAIALSCLAALDASAENIDTARAKFDQADDLLRSSSVSPLLSALRLHRGHLDVALAKRAARAGQAEEAIQHLHDALQRASEATTDTEALHSDEARFALRMLRRSLDAYEKSHVPSASNEPADALVVAADARWFRPPHGVRIDLSRRGSMPRILDALAHHRFHTPGVSLSAAELTERGWPGVRILPQAAAKRFYMAIFTLRQLGLRDVLLSRDNGYLLDPDVPLVRVD